MGVAIIALIIACVIGWHASKVHMSHGLIPTRKGQLPGMRRERTRYLLRTFLLAVIVVVILVLVAKH
jgi:uncharacterized membrane protein